MAFLSGWTKRVKLTVDQTLIDTANQADFPISVQLSTSSGITSVDVSCVFDELTSDANRKKIAITTGETTECYVEIERWDDANEEAVLWVKVPSVSHTVDTDLYLYYDSLHADNTAYVGDTTDAVTHNVWDSNFKGVWHMGQDPSGGASCIKDSTSNANDGTPGGGMTTADLVDGTIGKAIDFDGTDDYVNCGSNSSLDDIDQKTVEGIINADTFGGGGFGRIVDKAESMIFLFDAASAGTFRVYQGFSTTNGQWSPPTSSISTSTIYGIAVTYDRTSVTNDPLIFINSVSQTVTENFAPVGVASSDASADLILGNSSSGTRGFDGKIDEQRISDVIRTPAWIKATYHSNFDTLVTFGTEEALGSDLLDGKIKITRAAANLFDGEALVESSLAATNLADGKAIVKNAATVLLDGQADVKIPAAVTWNPSDRHGNITLDNSNRSLGSTGGTTQISVRSTESKSSDQWYWEVRIDGDGLYTRHCTGIGTSAAALAGQPGFDAHGYGYDDYSGRIYHNGSSTVYGDTFVPGDIIGIALDMDAGKIWFAKNNTWQNSGDPVAGTGEAFSGIAGTFFAMTSVADIGDQQTGRFAATHFTYTPPSGFEPYEYETGHPIELLDGTLKVRSAATNLFDGKAEVSALADLVFDGKASVTSASTSQLDGRAQVNIAGDATNLLDGKAEVTAAGDATNLLDGKVLVSAAPDTQFDGRANVRSALPIAWNPLDKHANCLLSNNNLTAENTGGGYTAVRATQPHNSYKWYFEVRRDADGTSSNQFVGVANSSAPLNSYPGQDSDGWGYRLDNGMAFHNGGAIPYGGIAGVGDIIGVAVDFGAGKIYFSLNGVWQNSSDPVAGTGEAYDNVSGVIYPEYSPYGNGDTATGRFASADFTYPIPIGYGAWEEHYHPTDLLDGKLRIRDAGVNLLDGKASVGCVETVFDGKAQVSDATTNLLDGKAFAFGPQYLYLDGRAGVGAVGVSHFNSMLTVGSRVYISGSSPPPTADIRIGLELIAEAVVADGLFSATHIPYCTITGGSPPATCSMRAGILLEAQAVTPTCSMVAITEHVANIFGQVPPPTGNFSAQSEIVATIFGRVPPPQGHFTVTVGNVANIHGRVPTPTCTMSTIGSNIVSIYGRVPVPGTLVRFYASELNGPIVITGVVPTPDMTACACCIRSMILRHVRGEVR